MKRISIVIWLMLIVGCAGSPLSISMKSPEELKTIPDEQLCDAYASYKSQKIRNELETRELFTDQEWRAIEKNDIFTGMSKKALIASRPNLYLTGISNIAQYGMVEIYSEFATTVSVYIYVQNDKVVGYQMF